MMFKILKSPAAIFAVLLLWSICTAAASSAVPLQWKQKNWKGNSIYSKLDDNTLVITRDDPETSGAWHSQSFKAQYGEHYYISAEIAAKIKTGHAAVVFDFRDKNGKRIKSVDAFKVRKSSSFKKYEATVKVPKGSTSFQLLAAARHASGQVKFRKIGFQKIKLPKTAFTANGLTWRPAAVDRNSIYRISGNEFIIERPENISSTGYWETDPVPVKPGDLFLFSADAKGEKFKDGYMRMIATFYDQNHKHRASHNFFYLSDIQDFLTEKFKFQIPENTAFLRLQAFNRNGAGIARFRNVSITKLDTKDIFSEHYFTRDDLSTRISWRSSGPEPERAKVTFRSPGRKDIVIWEPFTNAANHSVILPAGKIPAGKSVSAEISYSNGVSKTVRFISGTPVRIVKSKPFAIPLSVAETTAKARKSWPVAGGIPFKQGILRDVDDVMLLDGRGKEKNAEFNVISRWKDGSVQFLGFAFETATDTGKPVTYTLTNSNGSSKKSPVQIFKSELLNAMTGRIVTAGGKEMICKVADGKKTVQTSAACTTTQITGDFSGDAGFGYRLFIRSFASGITTVQYSIYGGREDTLIRSIQWELPALNEPEFSDRSKPGRHFSTLQRDEKNGTGDGFIRDRKANLAIGMLHYREKWPKGLAHDDRRLALQLLPPLPPDYPDANTLKPLDIVTRYYWLKDNCYTFRRKLELTGSFIISGADADAAWFKSKLIAAAAPEYYCSTGVFENIAPRKAGEFDRYEKIMDSGFETIRRDREKFAQYGWMNLGDWFGERYYNWGNNEYDLAFIMALFYARTGDLRYFRRGMEMADHYQSIDRYTPRNDMERRTKYEHCSGHTGNFFTKGDKRFNNFNFRAIIVKEAFDPSGGHNFEKGSLLMAGLAGDKYLFDKAMDSIEQLARRFTDIVQIPIERCPGWLLENLVAGYFFTSDPYYSNASEIVIDAVSDKQTEQGGLSVRQNFAECKCPDKYSHRGGKAFAVGVLMHSLGNYYDLTGYPTAKKCILGLAKWLLNDSWDPVTYKFRYKTNCANYKRGSRVEPLLLDTLYRASKWSGDPRGKDLILQHLGRNFPYVPGGGGGQGVTKRYSMNYRHMPHLFKLLKDDGITDLKIHIPESMRKMKSICVPAGSIKIEAEDFVSEKGGKVIAKDDKIGADVCLVAWSAKHALNWSAKNPAGKYKIAMRYCSPGDTKLDIRINNRKSGRASVAGTFGRGEQPTDWITAYLTDRKGNVMIFDLPENAQLQMQTISKPGPNPDCFHLIPVH